MGKVVHIYFVRHGQTYFNVRGRIQGQCDSPLTEQGIQDAKNARDALAHVPFSRAYSSNSGRAMDTAEIILEKHPDIPFKRLNSLREFDFGLLDGERFTVADAEFEKRRETMDFTDIGGESPALIQKRIQESFQQIVEESENEDKVLVVSHGTFARHVILSLLQIEYHNLPEYKQGNFIPNGSIMRFDYDNGNWKLIQMSIAANQFVDC